MNPVIGLTVSVQDDGSVSLLEAYSRAIAECGGIPILIPYVKNTDIYDDIIRKCDGIFVTGGADIDPRRYGDDKKNTCGQIQSLRDEMEFNILGEALCNNLPDKLHRALNAKARSIDADVITRCIAPLCRGVIVMI